MPSFPWLGFRNPTKRLQGRQAERRLSFEPLESRELLSLTLQVDYSLDQSGFFADPSRRILLEETLGAIVARLDDTLSSVSSRSYSFSYGTGQTPEVTTSVPANTLMVFVCGAPLAESAAGIGGPSFSASTNVTKYRGQANDYDFAPNTSFIAFDNDGSTSWFFGATTTGVDDQGRPVELTATALTDFVTVARHEFLHGLGVHNEQPTFARLVSGTSFVGANAMQANRGKPVPLSPQSLSHVDDSLPSLMNVSRPAGKRSEITNLDWGILKDLGWKVVDRPDSLAPMIVDTTVTRLKRKGLTAVTLHLNVDLDAPSTALLGHYSLKQAGRDRKFGSRDDRPVGLRSARYDVASRSVVVTLARGYQPKQKLQLTVNSLASTSGVVQQSPFVVLV